MKIHEKVKEAEETVYAQMCMNCEFSKKCHEEAIECEEFTKKVKELKKGGIKK